MHEPSPTILVVDDEPIVLDICRRILDSDRHHVLTARNGLQALAVLDNHRVELVVTDLFMAEMDGFETIRAVRERYPDVRLLAISGGGSTHDLTVLESALEMGAHRVLAKPFTPEELLRAVRRLLATRECLSA